MAVGAGVDVVDGCWEGGCGCGCGSGCGLVGGGEAEGGVSIFCLWRMRMGMVVLKTLGRRRDIRFSKRKICSSLVASTLVYLKSANVYVQNTDSHAPYPAPTHPPRPSSHSVKPFFPNPCLDTNKYLNPTHTTPPLPPQKMVPPPPPPPPY